MIHTVPFHILLGVYSLLFVQHKTLFSLYPAGTPEVWAELPEVARKMVLDAHRLRSSLANVKALINLEKIETNQSEALKENGITTLHISEEGNLSLLGTFDRPALDESLVAGPNCKGDPS